MRRRVAEETRPRPGRARPRSGRWPTRSTSSAPSASDLAAMRRTVHPLARRLAARLAARRRLGREGRLDFRRTVRASLGTGGVPVATHHRPRRPHKPELVVLCDVSGSVAGFAHFTLMLTAALREQFARVRAFAFVDTCDEVTRLFAPGRRPGRRGHPAGPRGRPGLVRRAQRLRPRACGLRRAVAGCRRAEDLAAGARRRPHQLPRPGPAAAQGAGATGPATRTGSTRSRAGSGAAATRRRRRYGEVIEMVECRNVAQLADFVGRLLPG